MLLLQMSMSGIAISSDAVNLFYFMKAKSTYRWAMWGINNTGTEVGCSLTRPHAAHSAAI